MKSEKAALMGGLFYLFNCNKKNPVKLPLIILNKQVVAAGHTRNFTNTYIVKTPMNREDFVLICISFPKPIENLILVFLYVPPT